MRSVTTGRQDESQVVITSGLNAGEVVIASGFSRLSDGAKVRVMNNESIENGEKSGGSVKKSFENKSEIPPKIPNKSSPKQEAVPKQ